MRTLLIILSILVFILLGVAIYGKKQGWIGKELKEKVSTENVQQRDIIETVTASGKIYPKIEVKISPDVSGEVVTLNVEEGDSVKAGVLLARIDPEMYRSMIDRADAAVNTAKANTANSEARFSQANVQIEQAQTVHNRNKKLFADDVISAVELENSDIALKTALAELEALKKTIEASGFSVQSAQASLKEAKDNFNKTNIYAPIAGIISLLNVEKGERVVGTSQFSGTEIMRIANFDEMEARVDVSENDVLRVSEGDTAIVEVDAYIDRKFKGVVTQIASSANSLSQLSTDQVTNFTVKIRLLKESYQDIAIKNQKRQQLTFRPGMSVSVDIQTEKIPNVLSVPVQSVTARTPSDSLKSNKNEKLREVVFVYENGRVKAQEVSIGIQDDTYIQILKGLSEGSEIVSAPYRAISKKLKDNMEVSKVDKDKLFEKK